MKTAPNPGFARRERRGFTLIELLVVIAIIAVLAALLVPALKEAQRSAKSAMCLSNQHQVALGLLAYAQDHDTTFPLYWNPARGIDWGSVLAKELEYLPVPSNIFFCPTALPATYESALSAWSRRPLAMMYGMPLYWNDPNVEFMSKPYGTPGAETGLIVHSEMNRPSETFLLTDSFAHYHATNDGHVGTQWYYVYNNWSGHPIHLRHNGGANAAMADGSVSNRNIDYFRKAYTAVWILTGDGDVTK